MGKKKTNTVVDFLINVSESVGEGLLMAATASRVDRDLDSVYSALLGNLTCYRGYDKEFVLSLPEGADDRARQKAFDRAEREWKDLCFWRLSNQSVRVQVKDHTGAVIFERTRHA